MSKVRRVSDSKDDEENYRQALIQSRVSDSGLLQQKQLPRTSIVIRRSCFSCCGVSEERNFSNALGQLKIIFQVERRKSSIISRIACEVKRRGTDVFDVPYRHGKYACKLKISESL